MLLIPKPKSRKVIKYFLKLTNINRYNKKNTMEIGAW